MDVGLDSHVDSMLKQEAVHGGQVGSAGSDWLSPAVAYLRDKYKVGKGGWSGLRNVRLCGAWVVLSWGVCMKYEDSEFVVVGEVCRF